MVRERNDLHRKIACLENKRGRITTALAGVERAIRHQVQICPVDTGSIISLGSNLPALPPVSEIMETQNNLLNAKRRLGDLERRIASIWYKSALCYIIPFARYDDAIRFRICDPETEERSIRLPTVSSRIEGNLKSTHVGRLPD